MRVLLTNTGSWGTGSGVVAEAVLEELRQKGHEALLFFPDAQRESPENERYYSRPDLYHIWRYPIERGALRLPTFPLMIPDPNPRSVGALLTFRDLSEELLRFYFDEAGRELRKVIDSFQPDVVESQHIWSMAYLLGELGIPYIVTAHHSDQMGYRYDQRMRPFANRAAAGARFVFAISEFVRREVLDLYPGIAHEKVIVLENGYSERIFYPRRVGRARVLRALGVGDVRDLPIISFSGKISRTKGVDVLLRANRLLQQERKALLVIAGTGRLEDEFSAEERANFHLENAHFVGHHPQARVAELLNVSAVSVMPSRTEGFGIAALEAMACGTPVVATRSGGPELFVVGATVAVEDAEELAEALLEILALQPRAARELRRAAIEKARGYSWSRNVDRRLSYYLRALQTAR